MTTGPSEKKPGTCPTCGAENAPGSRFCERCGTRLPPSSREAAGPTPTAPADATLTFERPLAGFPREEQAAPDASAEQPAAMQGAEGTRDSAAPLADDREEGASFRDAPTTNFDLPTLPTPEQRGARDAATLSFDLPEWAQYEKAEDTTTPSTDRDAPATPVTSEATPTETDTAEVRSWDYRPWTPQDPAAQPAPPPAAEQGGTHPALVLPPDAPSQGSVPAATAAGTQVTPPAIGYQTSPTGQFVGGAQSAPPTQGAYTYPAPGPMPGPTPQPAGQLPPATGAGAPAAYGYPQGGANAWSPPSATAYPAPANGNNNRTLWIILGVVGGLLILCAMICVLIFLVGVVSASTTGAVATGVATTTRP